MSAAFLVWSDGRLTWEGDSRMSLPDLPPLSQGDLGGLFVLPGSYVWIPGRPGALWRKTETWVATPLPHDLSEGSKPFFHEATGAMSFLSEGRIDMSVGEEWVRLGSPPGVRALDVSREGDILAVGVTSSSGRLGRVTAPALWCFSKTKQQWDLLSARPSSWWSASRALGLGGFDAFDAIDAVGQPFVMASESVLLDDPSWFLHTRKSNGEIDVFRLKRRSLVDIGRRRDGLVHASTSDGEVWELSGTRWIERGIGPVLGDFLLKNGYPRDRWAQVSVKDDQASAVVRIYRDGKRAEEIALYSADRGATWDIVFVERSGERRLLLSACLEASV